MRIKLSCIIQALVCSRIHDADGRLVVFTISDIHTLCAGVVPEIVSVLTKIQGYGQVEILAVVDAQLAISGVGHKQFISVTTDVEHALRFSQAGDSANDLAGESINDLHTVVAERRTDHPSAFRVHGKMVNATDNVGQGNFLHYPQWGTLPLSGILPKAGN